MLLIEIREVGAVSGMKMAAPRASGFWTKSEMQLQQSSGSGDL